MGGLLLVSPEHRLSLHLKQDELWGVDPSTWTALAEMDLVNFVDIMDENDVLLHHRCARTCVCVRMRDGVCAAPQACARACVRVHMRLCACVCVCASAHV